MSLDQISKGCKRDYKGKKPAYIIKKKHVKGEFKALFGGEKYGKA